MKHILTSFCFIIHLLYSPALFSQDVDTEYEGQPYYFDKGNNKMIALEKQLTKMKNKAKMLGYGGSSMSYTINGEKSTVTLPRADSIELHMSGGGMMMSMMDPAQFISLYKCDLNKGNREVIMVEAKGIFGGGKQKDGSEKISFSVKKKEDKVIFVPDKKLSPGEYALINMMNMSQDQKVTAHCFRIE